MTLPNPVDIRLATPADATPCGAVLYEAFRELASRNNRVPDFPSADFAAEMMAGLIANPDTTVVVAVADGGAVVGGNCLWHGDRVAGIGPTFVHPGVQSQRVGRQLMQAVLARAQALQVAGVRLVQTTYNQQSLALYSKTGFVVREALANLQGDPLPLHLPGRVVRPVQPSDQPACNRLHADIHGHDRASELAAAVAQGTAQLVTYDGAVTGYATEIGFFGHAVGRSNDDLKALIGAAATFGSGGFYVPLRNHELYHWCLLGGMRLSSVETLMTIGLYCPPAGAYLPSALY